MKVKEEELSPDEEVGRLSVCGFECTMHLLIKRLFFLSILCYITFDGPVAQLVRAPPCHGGGRGFEPHPGRLTLKC